jgi:beta-phosphoglucomutase family hydrolase
MSDRSPSAADPSTETTETTETARIADNDIGLPEAIRACLFDLDGVVTDTARIHDEAWKHTFDTFLQARATASGELFQPFDEHDDYDRFVDGRPRLDGVRSFLASRGIHLPEGSASDPLGSPTVHGLAEAKDAEVVRRLHAGEVSVYEGTVRYLEAARNRGLLTALVSASAHAKDVLKAVALSDAFDVIVDGIVADRRHLAGKPAPDTYLAAAADLGLEAAQATVFEDAEVGVAAGRAGAFGYVVGIDRADHRAALVEAGADVVVADLAELLGPGT